MVVQVESTSQLDELLRVLKRRYWWIVIPAAVVTTLGVALAIVVPKRYVSSTRLIVHDTRSDSGLGRDNTTEAKVAGQTIRSSLLINSILEELEWSEYIGLNDKEKKKYREDIFDSIDVETPAAANNSGQQVVTVAFSHTDPTKAFSFLDSLVTRWKDEVLDKTRNTLREQAKRAQISVAEQEKIFNDLGDRITELRKQHNISPPDPNALPGQFRAPLPFERLNANRKAIEELKDEVGENQRKLEILKDRYERMDPTILEPVEALPFEEINSPIIDTYEEDIRRLEAEIQVKGWTPENSLRIRSERQIAELRERLAGLRAEVPPVTTAAPREVANEARLELGQELEELERELENSMERLASLQQKERAGESETRALQEVMQQMEEYSQQRVKADELSKIYAKDHAALRAQMDYHDGPAGNPFTVLDDPEVPARPTEPDPVLIILFSVFGGIGLGLALAVLTEYAKSCFRSVTDLARVMPVPVLGTVNAIITRSQARRAALQRVILASGTFAFVGIFAYVLWAWAYRPELLSDRMMHGIEALQEALK